MTQEPETPERLWKVDGCRVVTPDGITWRSDVALASEAKREAEFIVDACNAAPALILALANLLKTAEAVQRMKFDRYKKRNGHKAGIEADDGEKCWIVHSDLISALECASEDARATLDEVLRK
jgi:hypothetical protein